MSDITTGHRGFADLGITPDSFEEQAYRLLVYWDQHGRQYMLSQEKREWPPIQTVDQTPLNQTYDMSK